MTTTTRSIESITYTILSGNLISEGAPTRAAVDRLAQSTADALSVAFPGASVECPVAWRTSGAGPRPLVRGDLAGDSETEERIAEIAGAAWESWCLTLSASDVEA
jgi:hypothetical protein